MSRPDPIQYAERLYGAIRAANFSPISFLTFGNAVKDGVPFRNMPRMAAEPFMRIVGEMLDMESGARRRERRGGGGDNPQQRVSSVVGVQRVERSRREGGDYERQRRRRRDGCETARAAGTQARSGKHQSHREDSRRLHKKPISSLPRRLTESGNHPATQSRADEVLARTTATSSRRVG